MAYNCRYNYESENIVQISINNKYDRKNEYHAICIYSTTAFKTQCASYVIIYG